MVYKIMDIVVDLEQVFLGFFCVCVCGGGGGGGGGGL